MIRTVTIALTLLLSQMTGSQACAGEASRVDETFGFSVLTDVPYVEARLDQKIQSHHKLDIYTPKDADLSPVILYIHDGGWAFGDKKEVNLKPHFFTSKGIAFVSMNYRLRWEFKVYDQVVDVVSAIKWIVKNGAEHGLDGSRIVLMGHQSGGHLATLAVSDPGYLQAENIDSSIIRAVVSIDSVSYDIPRVMKELGSFLERRQHQLIFGSDEKVWAAASPITHITAGRSLPAFALLHDPEDEALTLQAKGFAKALSSTDTMVIMIPGSADNPGKTDELIGSAKNVASGALLTLLRSQL